LIYNPCEETIGGCGMDYCNRCGSGMIGGPADRPPLGLIPKRLHDELRINEIKAAMVRYMNAGYPIPCEWTEEYNQLAPRIKEDQRGMKAQGGG
jgi:hypothetical protein